jgi:signal transduction histidine kinase
LIELDRLRQALFEKQDVLAATVHNLWTEAQEISLEIHRLSYQLHPTRLDYLDLVATVRVLVRARHPVPILIAPIFLSTFGPTTVSFDSYCPHWLSIQCCRLVRSR